MRDKIPILLVEDNRVDVVTIQRAFKKNKIVNPLFNASNGEEALDCLRHTGEYAQQADWALPGIVLLDLNMPVMDGIEFLRIVKKDDALKKIPVVVLTTSQEESDRVESFNLGVAGYIIKPMEFDKFVEAIRVVDLYWTLSELP